MDLDPDPKCWIRISNENLCGSETLVNNYIVPLRKILQQTAFLDFLQHRGSKFTHVSSQGSVKTDP